MSGKGGASAVVIPIPAEGGIVAVPIEDFCVVMVDGQVMLLAEINPAWWVVGIVVVLVIAVAARGCAPEPAP